MKVQFDWVGGALPPDYKRTPHSVMSLQEAVPRPGDLVEVQGWPTAWVRGVAWYPAGEGDDTPEPLAVVSCGPLVPRPA